MAKAGRLGQDHGLCVALLYTAGKYINDTRLLNYRIVGTQCAEGIFLSGLLGYSMKRAYAGSVPRRQR